MLCTNPCVCSCNFKTVKLSETLGQLKTSKLKESERYEADRDLLLCSANKLHNTKWKLHVARCMLICAVLELNALPSVCLSGKSNCEKALKHPCFQPVLSLHHAFFLCC